MRTYSVDYGDIHITLGAATLADATVRRDLMTEIPETERTNEVANFVFFITQIVDCAGLDYPFVKLTANPGIDALRPLLTAWMQIEETLCEEIIKGLLALRRPPTGSGEKKA